jgi:outer membrane protein assembly factor BamE (lipoprotein component of BamABCDE complex)
VALACLLLLPACAIVHSEIGTAVPEVDGLQVGVTTREQALAALGPPRLVRRQFDGELYTWRTLRGDSRSITVLPVFVRLFYWQDARLLRDDVTLMFDEGGVLRAVGRRLETAEADAAGDGVD